MSGVESRDRLYRLLPALYRQRDAARGEPLRALLAAMEEELCRLEADIGNLYDNWFIETCDEWVVPYLGDLIGVRGLSDEKHLAFSQRARVAGALRTRRRKGTPAALQDAAQGTTGWPTRVVEFFGLLCTTQHIRHVRPGRSTTVELRARADLARAESAFDTIPRVVDVRRIATGRGRHNLPNVGVFVCRLQSYPLAHRARAVVDLPDGRYTFDPLGRDLHLFQRPQARDRFARSAREAELPLPLGREVLAADVAAFRLSQQSTPPNQRPLDSIHYGPRRSLMIVRDDRVVPPFEIESADLSEWSRPESGVAVDVERGRLAFAAGQGPVNSVSVSYSYGFGADLGGGPYDRRASLETAGGNTWVGCVASARSSTSPASGHPIFATLTAALQAWIGTGQSGIIEVLDSEAYDLPAIELPAHRSLVIQAADGVRPAVTTPILNVALAEADAKIAAHGGALRINGLHFAGAIRISGDAQLRLLHCSVPGGLAGEGHHHDLRVGIAWSAVGSVDFPKEGVAVDACDSIIAGSVSAATLTVRRVTLLGPVSVKEIGLASESIFSAPLVVERQQSGAMRFSYVAAGSLTPPRFRCQPDLALTGTDETEQARIRRRVAPSFTSVRYGDPGYAQLIGPAEIVAGAEDGSEMGAFHHLHQSQRVANLRANLAEYLPLGLEAGVIFVT